MVKGRGKKTTDQKKKGEGDKLPGCTSTPVMYALIVQTQRSAFALVQDQKGHA